MPGHGNSVIGFGLAAAMLAAGLVLPAGLSARAQTSAGVARGRRLNSFAKLFAVLRRCWQPPAEYQFPGIQITVRFSLTRYGDMNGVPRVTYMSHRATPAARAAYRRAAAAALARCVPLPLTPAFGGAIAGRPMTIRFIDNRGMDHADNLQRSLT
jgi:hypothetical protein